MTPDRSRRRLFEPLCVAILVFGALARTAGAAPSTSATSTSLNELVVVRGDLPPAYRKAIGTTTCFSNNRQFSAATGGPPASRLRVEGFEGACSAIWASIKARVRIDSTTARFRNATGAHDYWLRGRNAERVHGGRAVPVARVGAESVAFERRNLNAYGAGVALLFRDGRYTVLLNVSGLPRSLSLATQLGSRVDGRIRRT